ncbi:DUF1643 domain-containing protein [Lactovum odontotermitis]
MNKTEDDMTKWIYEKNSDNTSRYILGVAGEKPLFVFGINPSTARPNHLDPTLRKVKSFAINHGYDSWQMLNVYPVRMTDPKGLPKVLSGAEHARNIKSILKALSAYNSLDVWAAFGNGILERDDLISYWKDIVIHLSDLEINWLATTVNKTGAPRHPLYESANKPLLPFDMKKFIEKF